MLLLRRIWPWFALFAPLTLAAQFRAQDYLPPDLRHEGYEPHPPWVNQPDYGNLLHDSYASAIGQLAGQAPYFANNGRHDSTTDHWACAALPAWINFEMPELRTVAQIHVWMLPSGDTVYQYFIEGSTYGKDWKLLVDRRNNTEAATMDGVVLTLDHPVRIKDLRLTVTGNSKKDGGARVWQVEAFARPVAQDLSGAVGSIYQRYNGDNVPVRDGPASWSATAWRGERVNGQFVVWSDSERLGLRAEVSLLRGPGGAVLPAGAARTAFVRHVMADGQYTGDILDIIPRLDMMAGSYRPVWLTVDVPGDAVPGRYEGTLTLLADDGGEKQFPLSLDVLQATLPPPADWRYFLDIWQHPWSIAAWHHVEPWSEEHMRLMRPYLLELANAGQKVITTTITDRPWNSRDYTDYHSMVSHVREPDGSWRFDYTIFDRYVELAMSCGINRQIICVSPLTWSYLYTYTDGATGATRTITAEPGSAAYADYWAPFLRSFEAHLTAKGWLDKTCLCMDEPPPAAVRAIGDLLRQNSPHLRVGLAGNEPPSNFHGLDLQYFSIIIIQPKELIQQAIAERRGHGPTTYYPCLDPLRPNTFVNSPPAEGIWLGYYTAASGFDGMARWAFTNWPRDPFMDAHYSPTILEHVLPAGDSFLVYPGPLSSIRWEMLRDGIQEWEKLRWLRERYHGKLPDDLAARLSGFCDPMSLGSDAAVLRQVEEMRAAVDAAVDRALIRVYGASQ